MQRYALARLARDQAAVSAMDLAVEWTSSYLRASGTDYGSAWRALERLRSEGLVSRQRVYRDGQVLGIRLARSKVCWEYTLAG